MKKEERGDLLALRNGTPKIPAEALSCMCVNGKEVDKAKPAAATDKPPAADTIDPNSTGGFNHMQPPPATAGGSAINSGINWATGSNLPTINNTLPTGGIPDQSAPKPPVVVPAPIPVNEISPAPVYTPVPLGNQ